MKTVLMVAEKPSLALSLAKILSNNSCTSRKGINGACSVHEYSSFFPEIREQCKFKFTSVCGHVMSLDFNSRYNNWDKVDPAELFDAETQKKEATPKLQMPYFLEREARGCSYIVLWLDCDKEGENICFEVIDSIRHVLSPAVTDKCILRAKFSAITSTDIKKAFEKLVYPNKNEALSVDARQELDLRIGCAFTRYQTKFFQGKYGDLDSALISYGPCQTPTLGFCVERHDRIQSFVPEPYWAIQTTITHGKKTDVRILWDRVRTFDREVGMMFLGKIKSHSTALVTSVVKKEKTKSRPNALNTVEMLRIASSGLGMGPHHTMQFAERLYTQGYISYPRTETTHYPENFDLKGTLRIQSSSSDYGKVVKALLENGMQNPKKGTDAGDHPPITPMRAATQGELGGDMWRLYDYITRHFIATVSPDCKYLQTTAEFSIGDEGFSCVGKHLLSPGFTEILPWLGFDEEETLPDFQKGENLPIKEVRLEDRKTGPPDYLTESELITLMEKHAIGTDASIPVHINNICERNYVTVTTGRRLIPKTLGIVLVHGYQKIDPELVLPTMRAALEKQLNLIAAGQASIRSVLDHAIRIFSRKFQYFVQNVLDMDQLFEMSFSSLASSGKPMSRCGKCRRFMKYVQAKPARLYCANCDDTYNLPQNGLIKPDQGAQKTCPLDEFELLMWTTGAGGKAFSLCPYCYNHAPFPDMRRGSGCNQCSHPTCKKSLIAQGVASCVECENGMMVLDSTTSPKWKLSCNICNVIMNILDGATRMTVSKELCDGCSASKLSATFKEGKSPLPEGATTHTGCVFCDDKFKPLVEMKYASMRLKTAQRGGRGGRGRGGRGRGRGRGKPKAPKDKMSRLAAYFV